MQNEKVSLKEMKQVTTKQFFLIQKSQVNEIMAYAKIPKPILYVMKFLCVIILDQQLHEIKEIHQYHNPSQPGVISERKLCKKFMNLFTSSENGDIMTKIKNFNPQSDISQCTLNQLINLKQQIQTQYPIQEFTIKLAKISNIGHRVWQWSKTIFLIRKNYKTL